MPKTKILIILALVALLIAGCGATGKTQSPVTTEPANLFSAQQTPGTSTDNTNAYPINTPTQVAANAAYPGPGQGSSASELNPQYFVDNLQVPTASGGNGVITGQLLIGGDANKPLIANLYLAPVVPSTDANNPPKVNFAVKADPLATMEISSGRFFFSGIAEGQYALVIWTPVEARIVTDNSGNTLVVTVKANEVTELGVVAVKQ